MAQSWGGRALRARPAWRQQTCWPARVVRRPLAHACRLASPLGRRAGRRAISDCLPPGDERRSGEGSAGSAVPAGRVGEPSAEGAAGAGALAARSWRGSSTGANQRMPTEPEKARQVGR